MHSAINPTCPINKQHSLDLCTCSGHEQLLPRWTDQLPSLNASTLRSRASRRWLRTLPNIPQVVVSGHLKIPVAVIMPYTVYMELQSLLQTTLESLKTYAATSKELQDLLAQVKSWER